MCSYNNRNVKVFIHFGPPKTGTSTLQKWLLSNTNWLKSHSIFYPTHPVDGNGVSSGNMDSIFSSKRNSELKLDRNKFDRLIAKTVENECDILLLSSEYFFKKIIHLSKEIPSARFIGYVRFGLDVLQSGYNQRVKRHGCVEKFKDSMIPEKTLLQLSQFIDVVGKEKFYLRGFCKSSFHKGNLISDFMSALIPDIGLGSELLAQEKVNSSYSLQALEVKRWFNQFSDVHLQAELDSALQDYHVTNGYSLFTSEVFEVSKCFYLKQLHEFLNKYSVSGANELFLECESRENKNYLDQEISLQEFSDVVCELVSNDFISKSSIYRFYIKHKPIESLLFNPERLTCVYQSLNFSFRVKMAIKRFLVRINPL